MHSPKGFIGLPLLLIIIIGLAALGGAGWYVVQHHIVLQPTQNQNASTTPTTNTIVSTKTPQSLTFSATPSNGAAPLAVDFTARGIDPSRDYTIFFGAAEQIKTIQAEKDAYAGQ